MINLDDDGDFINLEDDGVEALLIDNDDENCSKETLVIDIDDVNSPKKTDQSRFTPAFSDEIFEDFSKKNCNAQKTMSHPSIKELYSTNLKVLELEEIRKFLIMLYLKPCPLLGT